MTNIELYQQELKKYNKEKVLKLVNKGFDYNNVNFQIDAASRTNIVGKALALQLDPTKTSVTWISNSKDAEGKDILYTFNREEFIQFALAVEAYYEYLVFSNKDKE